MLRLSLLPLLFASTAVLAQTVPATAPAPDVAAQQAPPAAASKPGAAEVNARLNAPLPADQAAMKAHVMFLASDAMRGREAGSAEYDIAAQYVAAQFYAAGLKPGGDAGGYLQRVPLVTYKAAGEGAMSLATPGGQPATMVFGEDWFPAPNPAKAETSVTAPVVFVGYGIDAAQRGVDSYKGVDVRGKIVAFVGGAPARLDGEERAFFGSAATKARAAAARGAVGYLIVESPRTARTRPFANAAKSYDSLRMTWAKADGTGNLDTPGTPPLGTLSLAGAAKLFGARAWAPVVKAAAAENARFRSQALPGALTVATTTTIAPAASSNVVGLIPGSDPALKDQVVVLSAHLDHIGVGKPVNGDAINNGALDNAMGIASLIEEAKRFGADATKPRRTVMFLAVTAEEKGLVGSDYFANNPTVPIGSIVADVNLDMPILTYRFEDMVVFGAQRSTLGPIVRKAVGALGLELAPDPMPEEGIFVRSDHFRFVEKGVPSVFLWPGQKGDGKAAVAAFMSTHYHRPSDDLNLPIDWSQGPRFVGVNYAIAREIADGDARPVWNKGDYFGTLFKGPMAN